LFPYTFYLIKKIIYGEFDLMLSGKNCTCKTCLEKQNKRTSKAKKTWLRFGFFFKLAICAFMWYLFYLTA